MTLIRARSRNGSASGMDPDATKLICGKSLRPVRNRRCTRRNFVSGQRPPKRLFTPEIKRYLKDWLVRRRDNPYPNRDEKKFLAHETGLTYVQICNWFANWRRKLKNVHSDRNQKTWGHLIRTYNGQAQGNVEQFSICSDDSIWSEPEPNVTDTDDVDNTDTDVGPDDSPQLSPLFGDSPTEHLQITKYRFFSNFNNNTYYNRSPSNEDNRDDRDPKNLSNPMLLSKWLESAARFQPSEMNYSWWAEGRRRKPSQQLAEATGIAVPRADAADAGEATAKHDRDEVEAAVALTALAASALHTAPC